MDALSTTASGPDVDLFAQPVTLVLPDGTPFMITLTDIDEYASYGIRICINYATQIGASFMLLVVLLLLTKPDKRHSPIFILNTLCLALNFIRSILQCLYFTGAFYDPYAVFAGDYSRVPGVQYRISITAAVHILLLVTCIEVSLILQVHAVCATLSATKRAAVIIASAIVALLAIGFRFALTVINARAISAAEDFGHWYWLPNATNIVMTISICFFCATFVSKLGWALLQRRRLGLKQFGPLQIILIMGCQTLIIPAIFSILQYTANVPELGSQVLTFVAIFLPLSSLWAAASIDHKASSSPSSSASPAGFGGFGRSANGSAGNGGKGAGKGRKGGGKGHLRFMGIGQGLSLGLGLSSSSRFGSRFGSAGKGDAGGKDVSMATVTTTNKSCGTEEGEGEGEEEKGKC